MRPEKIQDALNYLDDDMIEEVDRLRQIPEKRKKVRLRYVSLAACFCLLMTGVIIASSRGLFDPDSAIKDEGSSSVISDRETAGSNDGFEKDSVKNEHFTADDEIKPETAGDLDSDGIEEEAGEESEEEMPGLLVRIDEWHNDGFSATVTEMIDTDVYPVGEKLEIRFDEGINVVTPGEDGSYVWDQRVPAEDEFPVSTQVLIQFRDSGEKLDGNRLLIASMIFNMYGAQED